MQIEIIQQGRVLRQVYHQGKTYLEAPPEGDYSIRLTHTGYTWQGRQLAVVSVDGLNIVTGETAGYQGAGYVLSPGQTIVIPGWRRSETEVAAFQFKPQEKSYTAQMGNGTSNTGVIGLAVFPEKERPKVTSRVTYSWSGSLDAFSEGSAGATYSSVLPESSLCEDQPRSTSPRRGAEKAPELGTGYGDRQTMHTMETTFVRASEIPSEVFVLQYAVREKLMEWGVPVPSDPPAPEAFPASRTTVPSPPGWRG